jgi:hypothetical protein
MMEFTRKQAALLHTLAIVSAHHMTKDDQSNEKLFKLTLADLTMDQKLVTASNKFLFDKYK